MIFTSLALTQVKPLKALLDATGFNPLTDWKETPLSSRNRAKETIYGITAAWPEMTMDTLLPGTGNNSKAK